MSVGPALRSRSLDALVVLLALAAGAGTALRRDDAQPAGAALWLEVAAVAAMVLVLLFRRQSPFGAPAATWLVGAGLSFADGSLIVGQPALSLAGMVAAVLLGNLRSDRQGRIGLLVVVGSAMVVVSNDPTHAAAELFFIPAMFAIGWLVGYALHERGEAVEAAEQRAAQAEREREAAARVAVAEERARIARELHDVVAHAVSVMVLQVGAVRRRMPPGFDEEGEALGNVENAGRAALAEMRRLLDAMRRTDDELELAPHPGLADLTKLIDDVRAAGLDVRLRVSGETPDLPSSLDLSAYRIVQEALTNTLKHADAQHADVELRYDDTTLTIEVRDDGRGPEPSDGRGHGLVGVRERVKIYGGDVSTGPAGSGGFVLRASLPVNGR